MYWFSIFSTSKLNNIFTFTAILTVIDISDVLAHLSLHILHMNFEVVFYMYSRNSVYSSHTLNKIVVWIFCVESIVLEWFDEGVLGESFVVQVERS